MFNFLTEYFISGLGILLVLGMHSVVAILLMKVLIFIWRLPMEK